MYKIGRNEPCPCGSGRKYKHCCSSDPFKNEKISRAAAQVHTYEELVALLRQPTKICRLKVTLDSMWSQEPPDTVSRTIEIEEDNTLYDLHWEIQNAFGWDNDHLYSFYMSNELGDTQSEYAGDPVGGDLSSTFTKPPGSAAQTELRTLGFEQGKQFKYLFDYGDHLIHTVEVLDIHDREDENATYPRVVEKTGEPPPQYAYVEK